MLAGMAHLPLLDGWMLSLFSRLERSGAVNADSGFEDAIHDAVEDAFEDYISNILNPIRSSVTIRSLAIMEKTCEAAEFPTAP